MICRWFIMSDTVKVVQVLAELCLASVISRVFQRVCVIFMMQYELRNMELELNLL